MMDPELLADLDLEGAPSTFWIDLDDEWELDMLQDEWDIMEADFDPSQSEEIPPERLLEII